MKEQRVACRLGGVPGFANGWVSATESLADLGRRSEPFGRHRVLLVSDNGTVLCTVLWPRLNFYRSIL